MADRKVIAVVGATGAQGGGLVRAILRDETGQFAARALTRNPASDKAQALAKQGVEVVRADADDVQSLARAFAGAHGAFCVTPFWEHMSPERELAQARNMAQAARDAGVKHVIWSTLEDTRRWVPLEDPRIPTLGGNYKVPHFDAKGEADQQFRNLGVPTTFLLTSFYWDNMIFFGMHPKRGQDGKLGFTLPMGDKKLPGIAAEDIGKCALAIFAAGREYVGKTVGIAGEHLSGAEIAGALGRALGEEVRHDAMSPAAFRALGFPGADDLGNMFQVNAEFDREFRAPRDVAATRALNPALQNFETWLARNKDRIPIE
ncbi:MAG: NmrA/HSCARG family protein [Acidobacteria bacterium]|nr:NmrA/HSCARG family protein [Acidobacteriota bacterium]